MFTRSSKFYWKKQLKVLLAFIVVVSGFPAALAPVANAADSAPNLIVDYEFRDPGNGELPVDKLGNSKLEEVSGEHTHNGKTRMYGNATKGYGTDSAGSYWYWTAINQGKDEKGGGFTLDIKPVAGKNISNNYSVGVRFSYDKFNPNWTKIIDYKNKTTTEGFYFTGDGDRKLMFYNVGNKGETAAEPKQIVDIIATRNNDSKMFTAYMMINGEFQKEIEINDSGGKATPIELVDGTIRFGFFHDDLPTNGVERPESGKVYSIKFWDGAITPAKALDATAAKGTEAGTKITATPESGNSLMVLVSDTLLPFPLQGEDVPAGAQEYTPGSDINDVDANTNKYVGVYEVDSSGKIVGFKLITLTVNEIKEKPVNKDELQMKIDDIEGKLADGTLKAEDYTADSWQALQDELEKAKKVFEDPNATKEQVDNAKTALENAEKNLAKLGGELKDWELIGLTEGGKKDIKLSPDFNPNQYKHYTANVTNDVYGISMNPTVEIPNGTQVKVYVNGTEYPAEQWSKLPLNEGQKNLVQVKVEDTAGNLINEYSIEIVREPAATAGGKLESLVPSVGSLSPAFVPDQTSYTMSVMNSVYQLQLTPTAVDPEAKIAIRVNNGEWKEVASGSISDYLALNVGTNIIDVKVTDKNGDVKDYEVTVTRESGNGGNNNGGNNGGNGNSGGTTTPTAPSTPSTPSAPSTPNTTANDLDVTLNGSNNPFATGTTSTSDGRTTTSVKIEQDKLAAAISEGKGQDLAVHSPKAGDMAVEGLTADTLKQLNDKGASLKVSNLLAIYPVPTSNVNLSGIAGQLGNAALNDIAVHIDIKRSSEDLISSAKRKAADAGYELLVDPVDLDLTFSHGGQTVRSGQLDGYAVKYIALPEGIDPNRITTGVIINPDGSVYHVPTVVTEINNRYFARINDLRSSGSYSVIWNPQDFADVQSHWGKEDVNNIAARLDLKGNGDNTFSPDRSVTRSEFAEIVVLGLGLMRSDAPNAVFPDVSANAWYGNAVAIANEFDIVRGYDNGNFNGGQQITREQGFAMIARAYRLIQSEGLPGQEQIASTLAKYEDGASVAAWAKADVAQLIAAGIIQGNGPELLSPKAQLTRAEVTALMARMLKVTNLIDK